MTMRFRRARLVTMVFALAAAAAGCRQTHAEQRQATPPAPQVSVVTVEPERVGLTTEWIATLDGYVNAQIRPQVSGYLVKRDYEEGAVVRKGQVLFEIDARPFETALAQTRAQLAEPRAIAQSQLDNDVQANLAAQAAVKSAQAAVETAQLNVGFTKVVSLVD